MGRMIRGVSKNARFVAVDTTDIVQEAMKIHSMNMLAADAFGKVATMAMLLGSSLKGEDILTLRLDSDGQIANIVVTSDSKGHIKGYVSNSNPDVREQAILGKGTMKVIKDFGLKEPYTGFCSLTEKGLAYDVSNYFYHSEQIPTVIAFAINFADENHVEKAGGYMIQVLPDSEEWFIDALERKIAAMRKVDELFRGGMDLEEIIALLYDDMDSEEKRSVEDYEILEEKEISYHCNCEKEKFYRALITLGEKELRSILEEDEKIEAECHFCRKRYRFMEGDFFGENH